MLLVTLFTTFALLSAMPVLGGRIIGEQTRPPSAAQIATHPALPRLRLLLRWLVRTAVLRQQVHAHHETS